MQYKPVRELIEAAVSQIIDPPKGPMLPLMPRLSQFIGGLRPHEVTLLCAGTGTGKTAFMATVAAQLISQDVPTFAAPVETGDIDFVIRVMSVLAKTELNTGEPWNVDVAKQKLMGPIDTLSIRPLFVAKYDNRVSIDEMKDVLEFAHKTNGIKVALLDNLNFFLDVVSSTMEKAEMDTAIHELVMFAKKFPIHTILICHPRKTENGRVLSEYDIKGSSTAVQECANVLLFNRIPEDEIKAGKSPFDREFVFRKIRKRGMHVNKKIYMSYENGFYEEVQYS